MLVYVRWGNGGVQGVYLLLVACDVEVECGCGCGCGCNVTV